MIAHGSHRTLHVLLGLQSLLVVLVSVNRLSPWTTGYVAPNEFLRWVDLNNLVLSLLSVVVFYLLWRHLAEASPVAARPVAARALGVTFIVGVYLLAASYGDHELTNYLHLRFCADDESALCDIVVYHDDGFSHYLFFAGFTVVNVVIMLTQVAFPDPGPLTTVDIVSVVGNALFVGAAIFANLAFEEIGFDLYVVAVIAVFAAGLLWRRPRQPILLYYTVGYAIGLALTAVAKLA